MRTDNLPEPPRLTEATKESPDDKRRRENREAQRRCRANRPPEKVAEYVQWRADYYRLNKPAEHARTVKWRRANPERWAAIARKSSGKANAAGAARARYQINRAVILATNKRWRDRNTVSIQVYRRRPGVRAKQTIRDHKYRRENLAKIRFRMRVWKVGYRLRMKRVPGRFTVSDVLEIYALQRGCCALCRGPLFESYHIDHIMPLALGGTNERRNIQLAHARCNQRKHAKHPLDFARELGLLL